MKIICYYEIEIIIPESFINKKWCLRNTSKAVVTLTISITISLSITINFHFPS